mgnify:CR=1 FL=1|jgi:hypothetical protein
MTKYKLVDHANGFHDEHWCVEIEEGLFKGVVYQYDTINIEENVDGGDAVLRFNTITVDNPNEEDLAEDEFVDTIGDILVKIISDRMEEENLSERNPSDT